MVSVYAPSTCIEAVHHFIPSLFRARGVRGVPGAIALENTSICENPAMVEATHPVAGFQRGRQWPLWRGPDGARSPVPRRVRIPGSKTTVPLGAFQRPKNKQRNTDADRVGAQPRPRRVRISGSKTTVPLGTSQGSVC